MSDAAANALGFAAFMAAVVGVAWAVAWYLVREQHGYPPK